MATDNGPSPAPRAVREVGYSNQGTNTRWYGSDLTGEANPELRWPQSVKVYDRMRHQDAQVSSVLRAVQSPIVRTQWWIDGRGVDPVVTRFVAANLGLPVKDADPEENLAAQTRGRGRFSWDEHLRLALLCLPFGHSFFEQVYYPPDETSEYFRLRKLGPRLPRTIAKFDVAADGGLVSITQHPTVERPKPEPLDVSRLVAYVLDREGGNWQGQSLLRSAYKNWLLKDEGLRKWSTLVDRNSVGIPIYTGPEGEKDLEKGEKLAKDIRGGDTAGAAIPHGAELKLQGVEGTLPDLDKFIRYQDEQIARSALGHLLNLGSQGGGQVGSYNLGSVFANTFNLGVESVAEMLRETGDAHVIEDLVDINFGSTVPAPRLVFDQIGTRQTELDRVREAVGLTSDADLVKWLRTIPEEDAA